MEICSILHKSNKDIIAKLFAMDVDTKIWGCWWDGLIWNEPLSRGNGSCHQYFGKPYFHGGNTKPDANHIVIDCGDDENLFFWTIEHPRDAYHWGYEIQGYGEKARKRRQKQEERERKFQKELARINTKNSHIRSPYFDEIQRINKRNSEAISKLMKGMDDLSEIEMDNQTVRV